MTSLRTRAFLLLAFALAAGSLAPELRAQQVGADAFDKARYDLVDYGAPGAYADGQQGAPRAAALREKTGVPRLMAEAPQARATLVAGGYFTLGTATAGSTLEREQPLAFGHPYAFTSYPQVRRSGVWLDPLRFEGGTLAQDADTLRYTSPVVDGISARTALWLEEGGQFVELSYTVRNESAAPVSDLEVRVVYDAGLGTYGDGAVRAASGWVQSDTTIDTADLAGALTLWERSSARRGLGLSMGMSGEAEVRVANWFDLHDERGRTPADTPTGRPLVDLAVAPMWAVGSLEPGEERTVSITFAREVSDLGEGAFLRADLPARIALEGGLYFPRSPRVSVQVQGTNGAGSVTVRASGEAPFAATGPAAVSVGYDAQSAGLTRVAYRVSDSFVDEYPMLVLEAEDASGNVVDRLARRVFVPAVPVSEEGIDIQVDSVAVTPAEQGVDVEVFFAVTNAENSMPIGALADENVILYDQQERIRDFVLDKRSGEGVDAVDIVFVLDVTGSMSGEIAAVRSNIIEFADSLMARGLDYRLGLVTFRDEVTETVAFTDDAQAFRDDVARQSAIGGRDRAENSLDALAQATTLGYRDNARRIAIWITDADYYESTADGRTQQTTQQVVDALLAQGIVVYSVGNQFYQTSFYNPIWMPTGGAYFDIDGNFRDILLEISRLPSSNRYRLAFQREEAGGTVLLQLRFAGLGGDAEVVLEANPGARGGASLTSMGETTQIDAPSLSVFPTPSVGAVTLRARDPEARGGELSVYDALGRRVQHFALEAGPASHALDWDGRGEAGQALPAGLYLVRLALPGTSAAPPSVLTRRLLRLR